MALDTVADYVAEARVLLQDLIETYRYPDADLVSALNMGIMTARRLRPDLFLNATTLPSFVEADIAAATEFDMDEQYRVPFVYFMVGHAQLRDEEDTQDARAGAFIGKFTSQLAVLS
jgi:hypothetical protein